ncbi:AAA family ATPase [Saccharopolyspora sp. ASAGF58]|uniref:AAA family ATPase n=1 Tax=Saccharopolyspora sp. ASAGF58 TaxID=2719023 RepID=UPI001FF09F84|nr:AAA family ATPase [Saccharopolyspora sp. ASAGF58]
MSPTGTENTRLVVLRGPSGAGKSSTARALRACLGSSLTWVAQDTIRRDILKERGVPDGANIELISIIARFALDRGWNVLIDGILHAQRYREMLDELCRDHRGINQHLLLLRCVLAGDSPLPCEYAGHRVQRAGHDQVV